MHTETGKDEKVEGLKYNISSGVANGLVITEITVFDGAKTMKNDR